MDHHTQYASQQAQSLQTQTNSQLVKLVAELMKRYNDKKQQENRIEIKVDGKVKFKGIVDKSGKLSVTKNTLTAAEIQALKSYFSSIPIVSDSKSKPNTKEPVQRADFDVQVNEKSVLKTEDGEIKKTAIPIVTSIDQVQAKLTEIESSNISQGTTIQQSNAATTAQQKTKGGPKP